MPNLTKEQKNEIKDKEYFFATQLLVNGFYTGSDILEVDN